MTLLLGATGCGVLSALTNPKVAWAIQDPAPMSVVVRRADSAQATTHEVERLLTETPTSSDSDWMAKVGPDPDVAASEVKALSADPVYKKSKARVLPAEVWAHTLPDVSSTRGDHPNLLAAIEQSLGDHYADIMTKRQEIAALEGQIVTEKAAADAKGASPDDVKTHQDSASKLDLARSKKADEIAPLEKTFLASARTAASHVPADQQAKYAPALVNMLQALDDADMANSAAAVRYPLALQSLPESIKEVVPQIVADIIEEKTGHRPPLANLRPDVTLDGSSVKVTLAGIDPGELGSLDMGDVTKEVVTRSGLWVVHALGLLATVNATKEALSFDRDAIAEILAGFTPASVVVAAKIPAADSPAVASAAPRKAVARHRPVATPSLTSAAVKGKGNEKEKEKKAPAAKPKAEPAAKGKKPAAHTAPASK